MKNRYFHFNNKTSYLLVLGAVLLLSGCDPRLEVHGNLPDPEKVLSVQPKIHTKLQVAQLLGTPSTIGTFNDQTWYYVSRKSETFAFLEPKIIDQQVLVVKFDPSGVVDDIQLYGYEDGRIINPITKETPTSGQELTVLQQFFGNIGRFNKEAK
ncbi:MAG: outer membrane protein assembly factor BamE [Alphaproteobacteria bacterium]|nr:outer membrane protein assembly factor BamE [Alphaproteobacteria bacterium]